MGRPVGGQLQKQAKTRFISAVIQACVHPLPSQVAEHERASLFALLLSLAHPPSTSSPGGPPSSAASASATGAGSNPAGGSPGPQAGLSPKQQLELQRLALHALTCCYSKTGSNAAALPGPPTDVTLQLQACVVGALQRVCTGGAKVVESPEHSKLYATLLRALNTVVTEVGWVGCRTLGGRGCKTGGPPAGLGDLQA